MQNKSSMIFNIDGFLEHLPNCLLKEVGICYVPPLAGTAPNQTMQIWIKYLGKNY